MKHDPKHEGRHWCDGTCPEVEVVECPPNLDPELFAMADLVIAPTPERNIRYHPDPATQEALQKAQDEHDGFSPTPEKKKSTKATPELTDLEQKSTKETPEWEEIRGQMAQAVLGKMEYRGFYDAGKYLGEDVIEAIEPFVRSLLATAYQRGREEALEEGNIKGERNRLIVQVREEARATLLDELEKEFEKRSWGHYNPFSILASLKSSHTKEQ